MSTTPILNKELIIGLVGGVGVDFEKTICLLKKEFKNENCEVIEIKLSEIIDKLGNKPVFANELERIEKYMSACTRLRRGNNTKGILALLSLIQIEFHRREIQNKNVVYIIKSIKRPEEYSIYRKLYGRNFILISVHDSMEKRKENLKNKSSNRNIKDIDNKIHNLIEKDFKEIEDREFGQNVSSTFPNAHVFLNNERDLDEAIKRFVDILYGYPFHTPTIEERNLFFARGMALRSSDLSRQVGAVITNNEGDIIATGCNDVPKVGGGFYEPSDRPDERDFNLKKDTNVLEKLKIVSDLIEGLKELKYLPKNDPKLKKFYTLIDDCQKLNDKDTPTKVSTLEFYKKLESIDLKVTDLLEYGRMVHAEMAAICDAARRGIRLKGSTLFCTTYPCHMCAKLIISVGIKKVIYIDPYPKSKATILFSSVTESNFGNDDNVSFIAFSGISPKRFQFLFKQEGNRKKDKIDVAKKDRNQFNYLFGRNPINYLGREKCALEWVYDNFKRKDYKNLYPVKKSDNKEPPFWGSYYHEDFINELLDK